MNLTSYSSASDFIDHCLPFLLEHEAENNLIIGLASRLSKRETLGDAYLASVDDGGETIAAAVMTPPFRVALAYSGTEGLEMIADDLIEGKRPVSGVLGPTALAEEFRSLWQRKTGQRSRIDKNERIYRLEHVTYPDGVPGTLRPSTEEDLEMIVEWGYGFVTDAGLGNAERDLVRLGTEAGIREGRMHIWENDGPVSMAAWTRPTPNGVCINAVYTPPELRGRGYATAAVAELSQKMLDSGKRFCFLFTDLANPTSNSIYQKIGYVPVCDVDVYNFE